jgi:dipeptidyl aminopeptidase/acylaminoacyl peptidase
MFKTTRLFLPLLAALLAPAAMADTHGSSTDPRIESLLTQLGKVRNVSEAALSPDGKQLAWVVETNDKASIVLADAHGEHSRNVGLASKPGTCSEYGLAWAPDSHHLAFLSNCAGNASAMGSKQPDIYVLDTQSQDKPTRLSNLHGYVDSLSWSPDGKSLGFLYVEGATRRASALAAAKPLTGEIGVEGIEVQRLAILPAQGGPLQLVTPSSSYIYEFSWAPDSQRVAYIAGLPPGDNNWWVAQLYVQAAQADAARTTLVDPHTASGSLHGLQIALPRWSPDGSRIAFIGGLMSDQGATGGDLYSVSSSGGAPVDLTPGIHVTPAWFSWSSPQSMLVSQVSNGHVQVAQYNVQADRAQQQNVLFTAPGYVGDGNAEFSLSLSADHRYIAFTQSSFDLAPEVYAGEVGEQAPPAVTSINAGLKPSWGKAQSVEWDNEGFHVQGWLLYPANYDPNKRYPMIVNIHGGPSAAVVPHWPSVGYGAAPFSALGYFVLMPNPRGSFGEGETFVQANRKDFGYGDLRDTLAGVDAVEKMVPVDDHRLGLTGWSYGGFMSMFVPTQTQRFRAVVAGAGIANWQSYYGQNLIDQWMIPFFGASVYDDPAVYAKSSAINFIKKIKTPTLIVVGERDAECPAPQSFEYWHALRALGVPTSLVVYPNEGHHFYNPVNQRDVLQRALNWFEKYLPPQ